MSSSDVGELRIGLNFDAQSTEKAMTKTEAKFQAMAGVIQTAAGKAFNFVTDKIGTLVTSTIEIGKTFEKSMSNVAAISGATGDELTRLTDKAKEMGENTVWSASDAADAMSYMAMAGWKTEDMLDSIAGVMDLATAAGADLATTSDIVTDALTAFGLSAADSGRLADVMAAASSNANTNVELLGETFKYVAPVAGAMGYSIEDTATAIGLMANAGIKGSQAGTALRSMFTRLSAPPKEAATAMKALGIEVSNVDGSMKPLSEVMGDLRSKFANLSEEQQVQYAKSIAGQEAMSGLLAIVNASDADFQKLTTAVEDSNGAASEMAAIMGDNLEGNLASLNSKFEGLQIELFNAVAPALNGVVDIMKWAVDNAGMLVAVIGGVTTAFVAYQAVTKGATIATNAMKVAHAALNAVMGLSPIGLIVAAVAGLVTAVVLLWNNCEGFRNFVTKAFETIGKVIKKVGDTIGKIFGKIGDVASKVFGGIADFIGGVIENIGGFFSGLWSTVSGVFTAIGDFIGGIINNIVGYFQWWWNTMTTIFSAIGQFFVNVFSVPIAVIQKVIEVIMKIGEVIGAVVYGTVATAVNFLAGIFSSLWQGIQVGLTNIGNFFKSIFTTIGNFVGSIANGIKNIFQGVWSALQSGLTAIGNFFRNIFNAVWSVISTVVNNIRSAFQGAWNFVTGIFSGIGNFFKNAFTNALNAIKNVFSSIGSFFQGIWNNIVRIFTSVGSAIGNAVSGAFKAVVNGVLGFVENFVNTPIRLLNGFIDVINNAFGWVGVNIGKINTISLPRMEHGGIVPGNDYSGDHNLIRANSGEMVITRSQQAALWEMISRGSYDDEVSSGDVDNSVINIENNYEINSALDAEEVGDMVLMSIRKAVV